MGNMLNTNPHVVKGYPDTPEMTDKLFYIFQYMCDCPLIDVV